ncbi:MAG: LamG domain-containing protein [Verrucomicrobiota bacterium]|jgi:hypothetical protein
MNESKPILVPRGQGVPRFILLFSMMLGLSLSRMQGADVLDSSLIMRLNFEAAPVGDVIADTSQAGLHPGTNNLATWVASEGGRQGVMFFNGGDPDQITVAAAADLNSTVGTIAFWMQSTNVTATPNPDAMLFDRRAAGGDLIYQTPNGHLANQAEQGGGEVVNSQTTAANLTDGQWHHVAYVYDQSSRGTVSFYVDGVLDTVATNASQAWFWVATQEVEVGASHDTFWAGYTGFLDDFRIYNRMLSASEVANVAGLGTNVQIVIMTGGQPQAVSVAEKDTASFSVKATVVNGNAAQLAYQWQKNNTNVIGATNATYAFSVAAADNGAKVQAQLSYPGATNVTSAQATLTVVPEVVVIYNFDAAPVGDVIVDSSTNTAGPHNGVNVGATWVASQGKHQGVMYFDGTVPDQITVAPAPELGSARGTIAFWMESSNVTQVPNPYAILFDRRAGAADNLSTTGGDVIYQAPDGHLANQAQAPGAGNVNAGEIALNSTDNQWHHIAYLYDQSAGGFVSFYVDGALDTTRGNTAPWAWVPEEEIEIGQSHDPFWSGYSGFLDEFRLYNRVLAPSEIAQLAGLGPQPQILISRQPASLVTGVNDKPSFSVTASVINGDATKLAYAWQRNGTNISGATSASYSFTVAAADDGASFQVQLSYPGAMNVTSTSATLTVLPEMAVHYAFDAAPQNNVIVDSSPTGNNNGVNVGANWLASQDGRTNVMSFDPTVPSQITIAGAPSMNSMRGTIAFWMESAQTTPAPNPYAILFDRRAMPADGVPVTGGDVIYQLPSGQLSDQAEADGRSRANTISTTGNPTNGRWHHVAYVYDQTAQGFIGFYIDGVLDGTQGNSQPWYWLPDEAVEIGESHDPWWSAYGGYLADLRIYNRVLSAGEIAQLAGVAVVPPALGLSVAGGKLTLSWSEAGFVLQQNSNLSNPAGWANVANGGASPVVITLPRTGVNFYRLKQP